MDATPPKIFISYSHDSPEHEERVLALSNRLRDDGIDAILDQYQTFPPEGWPQWMQQQVLETQFVLVICTEVYNRRAMGQEAPGTGLGATYESQVIQQLLYNAGGRNTKFIPVVFTKNDRVHIPLALQRYNHYLPVGDGYEDLYRLLTGQPKVVQPVVGRLRALPTKQPQADFRNALWNAPARNFWFTGREPCLQAIHQVLTETKAAALTGIGGIGKTPPAVLVPGLRYSGCVAAPALA